MPPISFTVDDIVRSFDDGTFARGQDYARKDKVLNLAWNDDFLNAEVAGSGPARYRVSLVVKPERNGAGFSGSCSCPVGYHCKHMVAALLVSLAQGHGTTSAERWLQQAASVHVGSARQGDPGQRLVFILIPQPRSGALRLYMCKARLRKDGSIGGASILDSAYALLLTPPAWFDPRDEELVRLYAALSTGNRQIDDTAPSGALGARFLLQACAEARLLHAYAREDLARGRVALIERGPARQATLGWHAEHNPFGDPSGAVRLLWRFSEGDDIEGVLPTEPVFYVDDLLLGELTLPPQCAAMAPAALVELVQEAPRLEMHERAGMTQRLMELGLQDVLPTPGSIALRERRDVKPVPVLVLDTHEEWEEDHNIAHDFALLFFDYDGISTEGADAPVLRRIGDGEVELITRDLEAERAASQALGELGFDEPDWDVPLDDWPDALQLEDEQAWIDFVRSDVPRLRAAGWRVEMEPDFRFDASTPQEWYADLNEEGEGAQAWFALELGIVVDGQRHPLLPILLRMIRQSPYRFDAAALADQDDAGELMVELSVSTRVLLPWGRVKPILSTLGELYFSERMGNTLRLPAMDAARLAELEAAAQLRWVGGERLLELGRKLASFGGIAPVAPPSGLQASLRPYQLAGLSWLQFLREYEFAGILADDMGLGKTIQTLAHVLLEKEAGRLDAPALVVAPTSLMPNWQAEAARFAPGLRVLLLHGKERTALFDGIGEADLVLTTYALLGRDEEALRRHRYHLLILDEAQYIKNSRTKASQTARLLDARHRLCLTGTPVQNHLGELWSQFHFLMPGLLGEEKAFNTHFRKPIENGGDNARRELLMRRLRPFMLRRTKDKVATELPPKTEIVLPVELGGGQRDLYETVRVAMDRKVRDEIDRKGLARSHIVILDALLKLRQVCCHPRLLAPDSEAGSAKLDTLLELLSTLRSEGRKVLVFSQFTSMLALIGAQLGARGIEFALLTGATVDRAAPVAAFQSGQVGVFLISLKAGGVGLNLTAADTVIHYDPWWNPASENQATDRAWRIGQEQPVFVYKLIARGTLEEKIQDMQRRKGELAQAVLESDAELAPAIGADDLQAIFARAPY